MVYEVPLLKKAFNFKTSFHQFVRIRQNSQQRQIAEKSFWRLLQSFSDGFIKYQFNFEAINLILCLILPLGPNSVKQCQRVLFPCQLLKRIHYKRFAQK